jgi:acyl-CoA thioesterase
MPDLEAIKKHFNECDRFCKSNGIQVIEISEGRGVTQLTVEERHLNGLDMTQGGAICTLADLAFAAASNSHGIAGVGIHTSMDYIKATTKGDVLTAVATEVNRNHKIGNYSVEVKNSKGEIIATFQGIAYFKKDSFPPERK